MNPILKSQGSKTDNGDDPRASYKEFCMHHDVCVEYTLCMLEDCFNMNPSYGQTDYGRDRSTIVRRFSHEGLSFLTKTLPSLFDSILCYLESGVSDYPSYKIKKGAKYPVFLQQLIAPIYENPYDAHAVLCMGQLYQICVAFKKLKGPYKPGVLIKQLDEFVRVDQSLIDCDWKSGKYDSVLDKAAHLIYQIFGDYDPMDIRNSEDLIPRPGPGATNTPTKKRDRFHPTRFYTQLSEFPPLEWHTCENLSYRGHKGKLIGQDELPTCIIKTLGTVTSRFKFVFKTVGKARGICIEELEMQWLQQALRRMLYAFTEKHDLTKDYVSFTRQNINALLALESSAKRLDLATIDMSEASDRISIELVERVFNKCPKLLKALVTLSSRIIELPEEYDAKNLLFINKFAPMGSALCFPVMGLVHFVLIKSILAEVMPLHINDIPVYVYGDDIIVSSAYVETVYSTLPAFGMKLNEGKSFYKSAFRESCGMNAYNGIDITPVRLKSVVHTYPSAVDVVSALKYESAFHKKGYAMTAAFIRSQLHACPDVKAKAFPYVGPESPVLGWIRESKGDASSFKSYQHLKRRWVVEYQRYEYRSRVIVDLLDDVSPFMVAGDGYLRALTQKPLPFSGNKIEELPLTQNVKWAWLPDSAFCRF